MQRRSKGITLIALIITIIIMLILCRNSIKFNNRRKWNNKKSNTKWNSIWRIKIKRKIRTSIGNIGYIKSKKISDEKIVRENVKYEKQEISLYENYSNIFGIYDNISIDSNKLNVVSPTFFYIDTDSKVLDKTTSTTATYSVYKNWTDSNGLQIMPGVTNTESVSSTLLTFSQRSQAINSLKDLVIKHNYLGINIKFDSIDDINSFYRFLLELYPRFKRENLKVAITLNDSNLEKNRLENVVDYIFDD